METGISGNGGMNYGAMAQQSMPNRPTSLYEDHQAAVIEWHEACHAFVQAEARRSSAAKRLHDITEQLAKQMAQATNDPTAPQCEAMPTQRQYIGR